MRTGSGYLFAPPMNTESIAKMLDAARTEPALLSVA